MSCFLGFLQTHGMLKLKLKHLTNNKNIVDELTFLGYNSFALCGHFGGVVAS